MMQQQNQNPFAQHPHSHPQFNPQKLGTKFAMVTVTLEPSSNSAVSNLSLIRTPLLD